VRGDRTGSGAFHEHDVGEIIPTPPTKAARPGMHQGARRGEGRPGGPPWPAPQEAEGERRPSPEHRERLEIVGHRERSGHRPARSGDRGPAPAPSPWRGGRRPRPAARPGRRDKRFRHDLRADGVEGLDHPRLLQFAAICSAPDRATARSVWGGAVGLVTSMIVLPTAASAISAVTRSRSGVIEVLEPATPRGVMRLLRGRRLVRGTGRRPPVAAARWSRSCRRRRRYPRRWCRHAARRSGGPWAGRGRRRSSWW
jgi:hypothetical protein